MSDPNGGSKGWWQTLPGLLTAVAAIITAVTGLLVAMGGLGVFHRNPSHRPDLSESHVAREAPLQGESVPGGDSTAQNASSATPTHALPLPETTETGSGTASYRLLSLQSEPYSAGKICLRFTIRMTNHGSAPSNFWSSSFRLRVDDSLQAPINLLDDLVDSNASRDGFVEFVIPAETATVGFQMGEVGVEKPDIPIRLGGTARPAGNR